MRALLVWWALALRGAAAIVYGRLVLLLPETTVSLLVGPFAASAVADGLLAVVAAPIAGILDVVWRVGAHALVLGGVLLALARRLRGAGG